MEHVPHLQASGSDTHISQHDKGYRLFEGQSKSCYQKATVRGSGQHAVLIGEGLRKGNGSDVFI